MFPHKYIHFGTWRIPGSNDINHIDHVLATSRHSSSVIDVRSCRGPNCDSDHYLVKLKVRERVAKVQKTPRRKTRRWDVKKLQKDTAQRDKYQKALDLKLKQKTEGEEEIESAQKRWEHLEQAIKVVAEEIIAETKYKKNEERFDEECATYVREENKAKQKMLQKGTRSNYEKNQERRRETYRICKGRKRENMKKQLKEINQLNQQNERRKFYKSVNIITRGFQPIMSGCKWKDGRTIGEEGKTLERWTEYFTEMLNEEREDKDDKEDYRRNLIRKPDHGLEQLQKISKEPTRQEIRHAIQRMRNNRDPGEYTTVAELIKYGGGGVVDAVHELTKLVWTTESMPQEWNTGIICPIYKKGEKLECKNYRGITFLNNTYSRYSQAS